MTNAPLPWGGDHVVQRSSAFIIMNSLKVSKNLAQRWSVKFLVLCYQAKDLSGTQPHVWTSPGFLASSSPTCEWLLHVTLDLDYRVACFLLVSFGCCLLSFRCHVVQSLSLKSKAHLLLSIIILLMQSVPSCVFFLRALPPSFSSWP